MKIYTRTGDKGETSLIGGQRITKGDLRIEAYGSVDELNAVIGLLVVSLKETTDLQHDIDWFEDKLKVLLQIQNLLFNVGSRLACADQKRLASLPALKEDHIKLLEQEMDVMDAELPELKNFILPNGSKTAAHAHLARTVCRRAERTIVRLDSSEKLETHLITFVNRLSDFFFCISPSVQPQTWCRRYGVEGLSRMHLIKATEADSERLKEFYAQTVLGGSISLRFQREQSFFDHYRNQSNDYVTYILVNDKSEIKAMASLIFREGWINGEHQAVGYATDLRVSTSRKAIMQWTDHFLPAMEEECKQRNCKYIFTVLAKSQRLAYNAFVRPRSTRRKMARYYLYRKFDIVGIHGHYPFAPKPIDSIFIHHASKKDQPEIASYIVRMKKHQPIYYCEDDQRFYHSLFHWKDLRIEDFLVARDGDQKIIGCVAPWASDNVQKVIQAKANNRGRTFIETLRFMSLFGLAHRLGPVDEPLHFKFLTNFYADNPDIFYALMYRAWEDTKKNEFLAYPHFHGHLTSEPPRPLIHTRIPCGLYLILSSQSEMPDFLRPEPLAEPPEFELAFY